MTLLFYDLKIKVFTILLLLMLILLFVIRNLSLKTYLHGIAFINLYSFSHDALRKFRSIRQMVYFLGFYWFCQMFLGDRARKRWQANATHEARNTLLFANPLLPASPPASPPASAPASAPTSPPASPPLRPPPPPHPQPTLNFWVVPPSPPPIPLPNTPAPQAIFQNLKSQALVPKILE